MEKKTYNPPWAIYFENDAYTVSGDKIMGRQAAGNALLKAYAKSHHRNIGVYARNNDSFKVFIKDFEKMIPDGETKDLSFIPQGDLSSLKKYGGLYYPAPDVGFLSNQRYFVGHNAYSIIGVTHTTASENAINAVLGCYTSPLMEWDALICTSNSVKNSITNLYDQYNEILKGHLGATKRPNFSLPIIPLGVHTDEYSFTEDDKIKGRRTLGIDKEDIVILFLGRLSFHAKAHHIPMYIALNKVKKSLPKHVNLHLIQTGWFPNDGVEKIFKDDAKKISPSVKFHFLDGKNEDEKKLSYAVSDIFISLVDNFQETFGLTPLEGMAAGMPAIVSDWNGYKDTVRNDVDGFRIETTTMEPGNGYNYSLRHNMNIDTYDHYIGRISQTVSVNVMECIDKIILLATNKDLRVKLGENARKRAKDFDWLNILNSYDDLQSDLDEKRKVSEKDKKIFLPPINIQDPYAFFNDYSTYKINDDTTVQRNIDINNIDLDDFSNFPGISFLDGVVPELNLTKKILNYIMESEEVIISDLVKDLEVTNSVAYTTILWLSKYGYVNIKNSNNEK